VKIDNETAAKVAGWPGDAPALLTELVAFIRSYVVMTAAQGIAVALWTMHTHAFQAAQTTPYLSITSAERRSGKSRLLEVLAVLAFRPLVAANTSEAALFRSIAAERPTVLLDEIDAVFGPKARDHEDLRALLNAGYRAGTPVLRCVGEGSKQRVEQFDVFAPKALGGIGALPDTIADRSLPIRLKRRARGERVERFNLKSAPALAAPLRDRVALWAEQHVDALERATPALPEELDDRAQDVVEPLLAIADAVGGEWPMRARQALIELRTGEGAGDDGDSLGIRLLTDLRAIFADQGVDRLSSAGIVAGLVEDAEAPWADWRGKGLTQRGLATILGSYGIRSTTVALADGTRAKGYKREQFEDAWRRYRPENSPQSVTSVTLAQPCGFEPDSSPLPEVAGNGSKRGANTHGCAEVTEVTDTGAETGADAEFERIRGSSLSCSTRTSPREHLPRERRGEGSPVSHRGAPRGRARRRAEGDRPLPRRRRHLEARLRPPRPRMALRVPGSRALRSPDRLAARHAPAGGRGVNRLLTLSEAELRVYQFTTNLNRRQLTVAQRIEAGMALEPWERELAAERKAQAAGAPRGEKSLPVGLPGETGETRERVAAAVGLKPSTYERGILERMAGLA